MRNSYSYTDVSVILNKTLIAVDHCKPEDDGEYIAFLTEDGDEYRLTHIQDCCESVYVEDIVGDLKDLVGSPLLMAEEITSDIDPKPLDNYDESYTWTFYKFATIKGSVDIRWYGYSNGYYSERVDFIKITGE